MKDDWHARVKLRQATMFYGVFGFRAESLCSSTIIFDVCAGSPMIC